MTSTDFIVIATIIALIYLALVVWGAIVMKRQKRCDDAFEAEMADIAHANAKSGAPSWGVRR